MRQFSTSKVTAYIAALLFTVILTACGGGTENVQYTNDTPPADPGGGNTPPPPSDPLPTTNKSVSLSWLPPLTYTDGSTLNNLQGHNIYMKTGSGSFVKIYTINTAGLATHLVENLSPGTYTFTVTAFNSAGIESDFSQPVTITL